MVTKLYLIPNTLTDDAKADCIAASVAQAIKHIRVFFVEEPKAARALLKKLNSDFPLSECKYLDLNEHTSLKQVQEALAEAGSGGDMAIISEAGYPCVADPGAELVLLAHQRGIEVVPLIGASSIILALASSGLGGQNFAFNGYLPKDKDERIKRIKLLEKRSLEERQTQIVMETPYRNQHLLEDLLKLCNPKTLLCVASDITGPSQMIKTATIAQWQKLGLPLEKKPTLFLF
ncbi:MAG: SAM-dependent methyltransferase [Candidatus Omnitrophica bacterium]|nr:SAM-dependent methyltransferase [Candidatus Omnitrophota bacterium]